MLYFYDLFLRGGIGSSLTASQPQLSELSNVYDIFLQRYWLLPYNEPAPAKRAEPALQQEPDPRRSHGPALPDRPHPPHPQAQHHTPHTLGTRGGLDLSIYLTI